MIKRIVPMTGFRNARELKQYEDMVQIAKLYYLDNLSQQQIANQLEMSRSNVSRILNNCKDEGIVEIRIHENALRTFDIKNRLLQRFCLNEVIIAPRNPESENTLDDVGKLAADYVEDKLTDGVTIGMGWGSTIYRMVYFFKPCLLHQMKVIQLIGGTGIAETYKDSVQLVFDFAKKTGGTPSILNAPLLVSCKKTRDLFIEENSIKQHLELAAKIDMAVITIGTNEPDKSTMVAAGYLTRQQSQELCDEGLFTHILGQHIDGNGNVGRTELNDRVVGIDIGTFQRIPLRVGVACGDFKARQIAASLAGGHINVLVTDELTALQVEQYAEDNGLGNSMATGGQMIAVNS